MYKFIAIFFLLFCNSSSFAEENTTLYEDILAQEWIYEGFEVTKTETGIDLNSVEKIKISDEVTLSEIHINLEGPFPIPEGTTLDQAMTFNINSIIQTTELNKNYEPRNKVTDGMGAIKLDVNGFEVGYLDYQVPALNMAKIRRAVIVKENRLYGFTIVFYDPNIEPKRGMVFDGLVILAVGSGKL